MTLLARLSSFYHKPTHWQTLFPRSVEGSKVYFWTAKMVNPRARAIRRSFFSLLETEQVISKNDGFIVLPPESESLAVADLSMEVFEKRKELGLEFNDRKPFLQVLPIPLNLDFAAPIFDFACRTNMVSTVANYLGEVPKLSACQIWFSPNINFEEGRSQQFHRDAEDVKQVKCFLNLTDIDENAGPLTFLSADNTQKVFAGGEDKAHNVKYTDEQIFKHVNSAETQSSSGPKGQCAMVDTSNCLHYGSRPSDVDPKPRYVLMMQYTSQFAKSFPTINQKSRQVELAGQYTPEARARHQVVLDMYSE